MEQIDKNTVAADKQLKLSECVTFETPENPGLRVLFVGNSITLHGPKPDIGWNHRWGMAASAKEKDYVHLCISAIRKARPDAAFCICQAWEWETHYTDGGVKFPLYEAARDFRADVIVMRLVENCPKAAFDADAFRREYGKFIGFLNPSSAAVILTTGFWKHPADGTIRSIARERNLTLCELGDLGEREEMKAIGLFEHSGVANHPGDLGMQAIADRICGALMPVLGSCADLNCTATKN